MTAAAAGDTVGQIVAGRMNRIVIRQKGDAGLEMGDLLVSREEAGTLILQVFELQYGSQFRDGVREMISGVSLEESPDLRFYEDERANYVLASVKPLAMIRGGRAVPPKSMPGAFCNLERLEAADLGFMRNDGGGVLVGRVRSGTRVLDVEVRLPVQDTFSHHVLIPAATGRGKSNLVKTMLWDIMGTGGAVGVLVIDAHDEYYGTAGTGLKDHPRSAEGLAYYTPAEQRPPGAYGLTIGLSSVRPEHFEGIVDLSDAQMDGIRTLYRRFKGEWVAKAMSYEPGENDGIRAATLSVIQRKLRIVLGIRGGGEGGEVAPGRVFSNGSGESTVKDIADAVERGRVVVLDTSVMANEAELIIGNIVASEIFERRRAAKARGTLEDSPIVTVVIEEAPRVIGRDVLVSGRSNIYSTIAKEGRKFKVGLTAITQMSSAIPTEILANMGTKIILGNEMRQERAAIIASAAQDLSDDDRNIAGLDRGEAIISSIFVPFAMPVKVPDFEEIAGGEKRGGYRTRVLG